ncbi:MAG: hypothetical protein RML93_01280 [Anaerolineales bacterium]|nr:hypothetical protein [Anaerolineales bacterium]MCS7248215.1 hypothetical protein [Anaerolineales bacterium]MDW8162028.1 hypothetical protein [Anaerolineales bacterium]MDW8445904.1 hypothetical protein [Anaerolineales bacterium]
MKSAKVLHLLLTVGLLSIASLSCAYIERLLNPEEGGAGEQVQPTLPGAPSDLSQPQETTPPSEQGQPPPQGEPSAAGLVRQWASEAVASSAYGEEGYGWSAIQATGEPNTPDCGDFSTAWASAQSNTVDWLLLFYPQPVYAVEVNIHISYNPDQVTSVELVDLQGQFIPVYTAEPRELQTCPYVLSIPTASSGVLAQGVRITVDQSILLLGWTEIDAVEMVGTPGEGTPTRPALPPPTQ